MPTTKITFASLICASVLSLLTSATHSLAAGSQLEITGFKSTYSIKKGSITIGETTRTLSIGTGKPHIFESVTRPTGVGRLLASGQVVERSEWMFNQGKLQPLTYTYFDSSGDEDRNVRLSFDWEVAKVTNSINGEPWKMKLEDNTQDKLLYQIRLMQDLTQGKEIFNYPVADGGKLKHYQLEIIGKETIRTAFGEFETLRIRRDHGKRKTTFWCATKLNYLPVRIEQRYKDNSPITATLTSLKQ